MSGVEPGAIHHYGRVDGQVVSRAVVVVSSVAMTGEREVLGCPVGDTETEAFWAEFLRSVRARGLAGVRLVISDHHMGLKKAVAERRYLSETSMARLRQTSSATLPAVTGGRNRLAT